MTRLAWLLIVPFLLPVAASAQDQGKGDSSTVYAITLPQVPVTLKAGEGRDLVTHNCTICHTLGYIPLQPGFSREKWGEIVHKMMHVYGAPVPQGDVSGIIDYLGTNYGPKQGEEKK